MLAIIVITILFLLLVFFNKSEYNPREKFTIQNLAPLYMPNTDREIYSRKDKQLPYCKSWNNSKSNLKCFVNKHLQRKCYWSCKYC